MVPALFVYDEAFLDYEFHPDHPFNPKRLKATYDLAKGLGLLQADRVVSPEAASSELLSLAHSPHYIDLVQRLSQTGKKTHGIERLGLGTDDNPVFAGMHEAASLAVGGTIKAAQELVNGSAQRVLNLAGGLHHAGRGHASGFCIYNDLVVAMRFIQRETGWRILYVDTDAHHGDGVQDAFYDDPQVFVLSLHESGQFLFPGTGSIEEIGTGDGQGTTLNVPLAPATDDDSWLEAFSTIVPRVMERFQPDIVVSQHGCDSHYRDPLADLCASTRLYDAVPRLLSQWVDAYANGRWLATGGGGYQVLSVVPRAWTILWAQMSRQAIAPDTAIPEEWLAAWQPESVTQLPRGLFDDPRDYPRIRDHHRMLAANRATLKEIAARFPAYGFDSPA